MRVFQPTQKIVLRADDQAPLPPRGILHIKNLLHEAGSLTDSPFTDEIFFQLGPKPTSTRLPNIIAKVFTTPTPPANQIDIEVPSGQTWLTYVLGVVKATLSGGVCTSGPLSTITANAFTDNEGPHSYILTPTASTGTQCVRLEARITRDGTNEPNPGGSITTTNLTAPSITFSQGILILMIQNIT